MNPKDSSRKVFHRGPLQRVFDRLAILLLAPVVAPLLMMERTLTAIAKPRK